MVKRLALTTRRRCSEISLFRLPAEIDPTRPFRVEVTATRPTATGDGRMTIAGRRTALPDAFRLAPPPEPAPLWRAIWQAKRAETARRRCHADRPDADPLRAGMDHPPPATVAPGPHRLSC